jgi:dethiobiotin synthetase
LAEVNYFVTGTDTGIGKTVVSALLVAALDAVYWKPVQSGACDGTDRQAVLQWAELVEDRALPECYCFAPAVSPHLAARMAGVRIDLEKIIAPVSVDGRRIIAEGAGGVLVPLNHEQTILDLIVRLGFPVIVTARTALGTINHSLLTLRTLRAAKASVLGVVMVGEESVENRRAIETYGRVPVIGRVPILDKICRSALIGAFDSFFEKGYF